jgi:NAD(P)-dependent dehydrogenase (short-subunit alcohol dehydrogenase family)
MPTVLVTGASRGIGAAVVHGLAGAEWDVLAGVRETLPRCRWRSRHGDTDLWRNAEQDADALENGLSPEHRALYARHIAGFRNSIPRSQRTAVPADDVAGVTERALADRRPRARYVVGRGPRLQVLTSRLLPTVLMDTLLRTATGVPRRA